MNIPPHINCVATLLCDILYKCKINLTIMGNKRVGKQKTFQAKIAVNDSICVRIVFLDIRRVERCVCF